MKFTSQIYDAIVTMMMMTMTNHITPNQIPNRKETRFQQLNFASNTAHARKTMAKEKESGNLLFSLSRYFSVTFNAVEIFRLVLFFVTTCIQIEPNRDRNRD